MPEFSRGLAAGLKLAASCRQVAYEGEGARIHVSRRRLAVPDEIPIANEASELASVALPMHAAGACQAGAVLDTATCRVDGAALGALQGGLDANSSIVARAGNRMATG